MNYLISYPRSGNTMTRFLFELMSKKPSNGVCGKVNSADRLQKPLLYSGDDYVINKRHDFKGVKETDFVVFVIRDYLEATIRHNEKPRGLELPKMFNYIDEWFSLLEQYDKFNGNKMLFYYDEIQKVSKEESKDIYPDAQSNDKDFHKRKLSDLDREAINDYVNLQYKYLKNKYL